MLVGKDFQFRWSGSSVADLFDSVSQTMPLAAPNSLSSREYADVTAYLLERNGIPAGGGELDARQRESLRKIVIREMPSDGS